MFQKIKDFVQGNVMTRAIADANIDQIKNVLDAGGSPNRMPYNTVVALGTNILNQSNTIAGQDPVAAACYRINEPRRLPHHPSEAELESFEPEKAKLVAIVELLTSHPNFTGSEECLNVIDAQNIKDLGEELYVKIIEKSLQAFDTWNVSADSFEQNDHFQSGHVGDIPIVRAMLDNDPIRVQKMLDAGADVDTLFAAKNGQAIEYIGSNQYREGCRPLLEHLNNSSHKEALRSKILPHALREGYETLQFLKENGVDIVSPYADVNGILQSPLMNSVQNSNADTQRLLLQTMRDGNKPKPLDLATHMAIIELTALADTPMWGLLSQDNEEFFEGAAGENTGLKSQERADLTQRVYQACPTHVKDDLFERHPKVADKIPSTERLSKDLIAYAELCIMAQDIYSKAEGTHVYDHEHQANLKGSLIAKMLENNSPIKAADALKDWQHSDTINYGEMVDYMTRVAVGTMLIYTDEEKAKSLDASKVKKIIQPALAADLIERVPMKDLLGMGERFHERAGMLSEMLTQFRSLDSWHNPFEADNIHVPKEVFIEQDTDICFNILCSPFELEQEDKDRVALGGNKCVSVAGYDRRCQDSTADEIFMILALRKGEAQNTSSFLSTIELKITGAPNNPAVQVLQNYNAKNGTPDTRALKAMDWLKENIENGSIALNTRSVGAITEGAEQEKPPEIMMYAGVNPHTADGDERLHRATEILSSSALSPLRDRSKPEGNRRQNIRPINKGTVNIYDFIASDRLAESFESLGFLSTLDAAPQENQDYTHTPIDEVQSQLNQKFTAKMNSAGYFSRR